MTEAKSLWKNLRDGHRQALTKKGISTPKWKYLQQMEFIIPCMTKRNPKNDDTIDMAEFLRKKSKTIKTPREQDIKQDYGNVETMEIIEPSTANPTKQSNIMKVPLEQDIKQNYNNNEIMTILLPTATNITNQSNIINPPQEQESQQNNGDMERHEIDVPGSPRVKMELLSPSENEQETDSSNCFQLQTRKSRKRYMDNAAKAASQKIALETFFSSMCQTTSNLSPQLQMKIQRSIFNVVMEAQEEVLKDQKLHPVAGSSASLNNVHIDSSKEDGSSSSN